MQYISNFIKDHKTGVAIGMLGLMLLVIGISIWSAMTGKSPIFTSDGGELINETYDPISGQTYGDINQEPEGEDSGAPVYLGFGPLLDYGLDEKAYRNFVGQINNYASENFPSTKYVSLSEKTLDRNPDGGFSFKIYFDSKNPTAISIDANGKVKFDGGK